MSTTDTADADDRPGHKTERGPRDHNKAKGEDRIIAPVDGHIANRQASLGSYATVGQVLMSIVPDDLWVTANFKETQLRHMRVGQHVRIKVDAFLDVKFEGQVDSIQRGAGQSFTLLPAQNATGNFVKIVPRVPVKIIIDRPRDDRYSLGPGMSVVPTGEPGRARKNMAAPFVLLAGDAIVGYYTLSSTSVQLADLPATTVRKLPRYPLVPATLLGRLAVHHRRQGEGYGRFLLADALYRAMRSEIASFAVVVDAKDEAAVRFYERESFLPLMDQPLKLFRPMADIRRLFND